MNAACAWEIVLPIYRRLKAEYRSVIAGGLRRGLEDVKSGIIVTEAGLDEVSRILSTENPMPGKRTRTHQCAPGDGSLPVYVVSAPVASFGSYLLFYTGPGSYRKCVCADARLQDMRLTRQGLFLGKNLYAGRSERQILDVLGLPFVRPCDRIQYLSPERRALRMRCNAVVERRNVWLAIDGIVRGRRRGSLPAKRTEIADEANMPVGEVEIALQWLARQALVVNAKPGWKVAKNLDINKICWTHGSPVPCPVCKRKEKKENGKGNRQKVVTETNGGSDTPGHVSRSRDNANPRKSRPGRSNRPSR